jgi:hypothetical protein
MSSPSNDFADIKKYYTLLAAAYSVCKDLGEDDARVEQYLHYARDGYREFHFDHGFGIKAKEVTLKPWKQIDFPQDMVDWTKIAFKIGDRLLVLTQDANIPMTYDKAEDNCTPLANLPLPNPGQTEPGTIPICLYDGVSSDCTKYYGSLVQYNFKGYFDVDWRQRVINFKETIEGFSKIYIEYIDDGLNYSGATVIHPYAFNAIKLYIKWQRKENDDRYSESSAERAEQKWNKALHKYNMRMLRITVEDIREATRLGWKLVVKN